MRRFQILFATICAMVLATGVSQAHFIFVVPEPAENPTVVKAYFGELAEGDDPALIKMIAKAQAWTTSGHGKPTALEMKIDGDALVGQIPEKGAGSAVYLKHTYGVMSKGPEPFLLMYYGKAYTNTLPGNWSTIGNEEDLPLEIVPELAGNEVAFKVLWKGKAAAGSQVTIESPVLADKFQGDTNAEGIFTAKLDKAGLYSVRARLTDETPGELDGKPYKQIRHYSTLALPYSPAQVVAADQQWPDLAKGMTSFGAAVADDNLYVYGGNYGGGHQYAEADQSGDFIRLNLKKEGAQWESLAGGPKLTGLAMAAHNGKLYRVGGFTVTDAEPKAVLNSSNSVARFDPAKGTWEDLAPLPEPRSSLDAVVLGDQLYVVGGWSMKSADGNNDDGWLTTAYSLDLNAEKAEWKALPEVPFKRRAISAAAHNGKLYVIGGMQSENGITKKVAIFDPQTSTWSEGPQLLGSSMDGFGSAAFSVDGKLIVTTMSGAIQGLSADGSKWENLGQLKSPRFFHESPAWNHGIVVVGGASMESGKALSLEFLPIGELETARKAALLK
ncbi:MAG TPA: DUF4198 domain-containing protein [Planctomicrobium sp.]|nr:DUF4198 domain-containing protein [Planctomicrobium sp.]